ncbi:hypothetical protein HYFRA_00002096, partial [Hymenoscyphus fraxineus]
LCTVLPFSSAFVGYGIQVYKPICAFGCRAAIESAELSCSMKMGKGETKMAGMDMENMNMDGMEMAGMDMDSMEMAGMEGMEMGEVMTTPKCRAGDTAFLQTLALCIQSTCGKTKVETWKLEKYWVEEATGNKTIRPKWSYGEALHQVAAVPTQTLKEKAILNSTVLVPYMAWYVQVQTMKVFTTGEKTNSKYGMIILGAGFMTPILLTILAYLPFTASLLPKLKPYLIYPSVIGKFHSRPLPFFLGYAPTLGQSLFIFHFVALNVMLTAARYRTSQPSAWYENEWQEMMSYVSARTGVLAFALSPLVILFAGRNNFLLWLTNWQHSTFVLLHRWVARIMGLHVIAHSLLELILYINKGTYPKESKELYWMWGSVATIAFSAMLILSNMFFRRKTYDLFLVIHIILAVLVFVGSWYHSYIRFEGKWGYEIWLYTAFTFWIFDRSLRFLRIVKVGVKWSKVVEVGGGIVRVDVPGVRWGGDPGRHAYAFFPTLGNWKPWENHPFSVVPTSLLLRDAFGGADSVPMTLTGNDMEKGGSLVTASENQSGRDASTTAGVTFYIRKCQGMTKFLRSHDRLPTLVEGPYGHTSLSSSQTILKCDRLILIAGGIGITAILPFLFHHPNIKFAWGMKKDMEEMVSEFDHVLDRLEKREKEVAVGRRIDIENLIQEEAGRGWKRMGVIVCGPGAMGDAARSLVSQLGRKGMAIELLVESYGW